MSKMADIRENNISSCPLITVENVADHCAAESTDDQYTTGSTDYQEDKLISNNDNQLHIDSLPEEILLKIFSNIRHKDRVHRLALVSAHWKTLSCDPCFWRDFKFVNNGKLDDKALVRLTSYSSNVKSLDLNHIRLITDEGLIKVFRQCRTLQFLRLKGLRQMTVRSLSEISVLHNLSTLVIPWCRALTDDILNKIVSHCPKLSDLDISYCKSITDVGVAAVAKYSQSIRHFKFSGCHLVTDDSLYDLLIRNQLETLQFAYCSLISAHAMYLLSEMKSLRKLSVSPEITDEALMSIARGCRLLQHLSIYDCEHITSEGFIDVMPHLKALRSWRLDGDFCQIDDEGLQSIGSNCTLLEVLNISYCDDITDEGLRAVVQGCPRLKDVILLHNINVTRDGVELLRSEKKQITFDCSWCDDDDLEM